MPFSMLNRDSKLVACMKSCHSLSLSVFWLLRAKVFVSGVSLRVSGGARYSPMVIV